ncbi:S-adenosyl-L-methionine-dependent methyltransferase [Piedraia hortae CBS 480.64]|uniref:Protein-lysine N-methyltransferase EFM4 n=1 Tax=Piedraia hortae CBS 480.64 TaxID=1314780 RepID=A0A6A7BSH0_9PEZI|nr:S-adenosyl-L-methionine-dependent methyltransferase [Piedraia hortae CBS 480.64]
MSDARSRQLEPSKLGTKEYWDKVYSREVSNHQTDETDEGTVWFSESGAEEAISKLLSNVQVLKRESARFLDLGTGNGHLLFFLREDKDEDGGWKGEMIGVDYSEQSIQLAGQIAEQRGKSSVLFERWDLLQDEPRQEWMEGFDVVLDKGTFDAISLMASGATHPCERYRERVVPLIKSGGFLCITSCNWTKEELLTWLAPADKCLIFHAEAKYPTFSFGGMTGQSIVTLLLEKL